VQGISAGDCAKGTGCVPVWQSTPSHNRYAEPQRQPVTHRARKRSKKLIRKERKCHSQPLIHRSDRDPVPADASERRRVANTIRHQRAALRLCDKHDKPKELKYLDYRYWELWSCFDPATADDVTSFAWWCGLQHMIREQIRNLSKLIKGRMRASISLRR
jgi:hypothetical protein